MEYKKAEKLHGVVIKQIITYGRVRLHPAALSLIRDNLLSDKR